MPMLKRAILAFTATLVLLLVASLATAQGLPLVISFIDVGQGDSVLIQVPGKKVDMLIDAGDQEAGPTVVNYLRMHNVDDIEYLISTHPHSDHIGGTIDVLNAFKVEQVIDSGKVPSPEIQENYLSAIGAKGVPYKQARAQQKFNLAPGITVNILGPVRLSDEVNCFFPHYLT